MLEVQDLLADILYQSGRLGLKVKRFLVGPLSSSSQGTGQVCLESGRRFAEDPVVYMCMTIKRGPCGVPWRLHLYPSSSASGQTQLRSTLAVATSTLLSISRQAELAITLLWQWAGSWANVCQYASFDTGGHAAHLSLNDIATYHKLNVVG